MAEHDNTGKSAGKPASAPQTGREPTGEPQTAKDESIKNSMALPHDRDESTNMTDDTPRPEIEQASDDLAHGLVDTSRGAESNRAYEQVKKTAK